MVLRTDAEIAALKARMEAEAKAQGYDFVSIYLRAEALRDGVLADITDEAKSWGFRLPVACTSRVYEECIRNAHGDGVEVSRVVVPLALALFGVGHTDRVYFKAPTNDGRTVDLYAVCGPGDEREPVLTVMFTDED